MRCLVIGGAGFLGVKLCRMLESAGNTVASVDTFQGSLHYEFPRDIKSYIADATRYHTIASVFADYKPEAIFISIAYTFDPAKEASYNAFTDTNVIINSANVICRLLHVGMKHVYFFSSSEVYGSPDPRKPVSEQRKIKTSCSYHGTAKLAAEALLTFRCRQLKIPLAILRVFDMYGDRTVFSTRTALVSFLVDSALQGSQVGITGANKKRDFIHVSDVVQACRVLVNAREVGVYNVGTQVGIRMDKLVHFILTASGSKLPAVHLPDRMTTSLNNVADISKIKKLGWAPTHSDVLEDIPGIILHRKSYQEEMRNPNNVLRKLRGGA